MMMVGAVAGDHHVTGDATAPLDRPPPCGQRPARSPEGELGLLRPVGDEVVRVGQEKVGHQMVFILPGLDYVLDLVFGRNNDGPDALITTDIIPLGYVGRPDINTGGDVEEIGRASCRERV